MRDEFIRSFADQFNVPVEEAKRFASSVAERCALLANRYEPEGVFTMDQLSVVETLGSQIGTAIIQSFSSNDHAR